jgi:4-methyl-5(b-hydroxyethyl)-thiazole monophosphate biosynthesis
MHTHTHARLSPLYPPRLPQADALIADCAGVSYDLVALPGGMPGSERLRDSAPLSALLASHASAGRPYAAMCAAPAVVLSPAGLLAGKAATAHPAFADKLSAAAQASVAGRVVCDGGVVTSRGPGTALEFSLALVALLFGEEKARAVAGPMVMPPPGAPPPLVPHEWRL